MHASKGIFHLIAGTVFHLGGIGLLIVGIIDSSFLTAPLANDFLVIALTASHPHRMPFYSLMAALGSTLGCVTVDVISRKATKGVEAKTSSRRLRFVESQLRKRAAWTVVFACLIPPPFPFTPFVALAAGSGYPRKKLLALIGVSRFVRFALEGGLAILYGQRIMNIAKSPAVDYAVIALIVFAIGGSVISIYSWLRKGRRSRGRGVHQAQGAH